MGWIFEGDKLIESCEFDSFASKESAIIDKVSMLIRELNATETHLAYIRRKINDMLMIT